VTAFSSNHFKSATQYILTTQQFFPCNKVYIYDLGLSKEESESLSAFSFVRMLTLNMTKPYFPNAACAFKPIMMLDFIRQYHHHTGGHECRYFFYGDASVLVHHRFDQPALKEVQRLGLIAQKPLKHFQIAFT
jgi:hypothetical protein